MLNSDLNRGPLTSRGRMTSAIALSIVFFGSITSLGLGILGQYMWLTLQNSRRRPDYIVRETRIFSPQDPVRTDDESVAVPGTSADRRRVAHLDE